MSSDDSPSTSFYLFKRLPLSPHPVEASSLCRFGGDVNVLHLLISLKNWTLDNPKIEATMNELRT